MNKNLESDTKGNPAAGQSLEALAAEVANTELETTYDLFSRIYTTTYVDAEGRVVRRTFMRNGEVIPLDLIDRLWSVVRDEDYPTEEDIDAIIDGILGKYGYGVPDVDQQNICVLTHTPTHTIMTTCPGHAGLETHVIYPLPNKEGYHYFSIDCIKEALWSLHCTYGYFDESELPQINLFD